MKSQSVALVKGANSQSRIRYYQRLTRLPAALAALIIGLLVAEAFLRTISLFVPQIDELVDPPRVIKDATLEYRFASSRLIPSSEALSNFGSTRAVKLVAIGDSITYGSGVASKDAWPHEVQALSWEWPSRGLIHQAQNIGGKGASTIELIHPASQGRGGWELKNPFLTSNMSCPGYGPVHYVWLQEEALKLKPDVIVATFYSGNDLFDAFHLVDLYHFTGQIGTPPYDWPLERILDELRTKSPAARQSTADLSHTVVPDNRNVLKTAGLFRALYAMSDYRFGSNSESGIGGTLFKSLMQMLSALSSDKWFFDDGSVCTTFGFKTVLQGLNLDDDWVRTGFRFSMEAYRLMKRRAVEAGVRFYVLVIPTKHMVFQEAVNRRNLSGTDAPGLYSKVIENETRIREASFDFFRKNGISCVDTLPALKAALEQGVQPYKISVDNHPNAFGQRVIAESVLQAMDERRDQARLFDMQNPSATRFSKKED